MAVSMQALGKERALAIESRRFVSVARVAAGLVALFGLVVVLGWMFDSPPLKGDLFGKVNVKTNTAIGFLLAGIALLLHLSATEESERGQVRRRVAQILGAAVFLLGFLTLSEHVLGWNLQIDDAIFTESADTPATTSPNRMGPPATIYFSLAGLALMVFRTHRPAPAPRRDWATILGVAILLLVLFPALGYVVQAQGLYAMAKYTGIALPTTIAFILFAVGLLAGRADGALVAILSSSTAGGAMLRRLLLPAVMVPPLIGMVRTWGEAAEYYEPVTGRALALIAMMVIFTSLVWAAARSLDTKERDVDRAADAERRSEEARRLSEDKFQLLANTIPQLAWMARPDGWIFWYNRRWFEFTGTTAPQMEGWGWESVHDPAELKRMLPGWKHSLATGQAWEDQFPLRRHDGQMRWHLSRAMPLRDVDGQIVLWFGTNTDITAQREAEEALRENEERLRMAMLAPDLWSWDWNLITDDVVFTESAMRVVGWTRGKAGDLARIIHPDDWDEYWAAVVEARAKGSSYTAECRVRTPEGEERWIVSRGQFFQNELGVPIRSVGVATDVTEQRRIRAEREELLVMERAARAEAEKAGRMKDEFLATLSHELRTPMAAILGWVDLLRKPERSAAMLAEGLEVIERNSRIQSRLIGDLLEMSRIISGKVVLQVQEVNIREIVANSIESVKPAAAAKDIRLEQELGDQPTLMRGDPARLQQVVWNLISNAIKFTPKGGRVQVLLSRGHNNPVEMVVSDTGAGIKPEFLPYVFDRFRQADASITRRFGGLGLGLAIVKTLVELHGGQVRAESEGDGKGATFTVEFPIAGQSEPTAIEPEQERRSDPQESPCDGDPAALEGVVVLVVDDEEDSRNLIRRLLEGCKARILAASSAVEAMEVLQRERPAVLISDIGMPEVDGYELIRRVRALDPTQGGNTPAAALTAFARAEDRARAIGAGYQAHMAKPVEPAELITVVSSLAGRISTPSRNRA